MIGEPVAMGIKKMCPSTPRAHSSLLEGARLLLVRCWKKRKMSHTALCFAGFKNAVMSYLSLAG